MSRPAPRTTPEAEFTAQRRATLARVPSFRDGPDAAAHLARLYRRGLATGSLVHAYGPGWQLAYFRDPEVWYGGRATIGFVDRDPDAPAALTAVASALGAHAPALDDTTLLELAGDDPALREAVTDMTGLGVDSVLQVGPADVALNAVRDAAWPDAPVCAGLAIREARKGDVDAIVALAREAFTAEPAYCWFGAYPHHLAKVREGLEGTLRRGDGVHLVVVGTEQRVLGHVGADIDEHPFWGRSAGFEIVLTPALRGRGLLKVLYREALARLVHVHGVATLRGGTAQPGVLALGLRMGRAWGALHMRRNVAFPFAHFAAFQPPTRACYS
jgi:hypothetical protein